MTSIDPSARISPAAQLDSGVEVGAYAVIGPNVKIGKNTKVGPHCVIDGPTTIGENNNFIGQASIGSAPQDYSYKGEDTELIMGDNNLVREFVTINRGTLKEDGVTRVGSGNMIMAYSHVAHDCVVGNNITMGNLATLAGHVRVDDNVIIGGLTAVHQFNRIGAYSIIGGGSLVTMDIVPFAKASGTRIKIYSTNIIGLQRNGFTPEQIKNIRRAYKIIFKEGLLLKDALARLESEFGDDADIRRISDFIKASERGIAR